MADYGGANGSALTGIVGEIRELENFSDAIFSLWSATTTTAATEHERTGEWMAHHPTSTSLCLYRADHPRHR